jgi:FKBP-type peptidyl-prolyl cis-trans isomerase FkpA
MKYFLIICIGLFTLSACKTYNDKDINKFDQQIKSYIKKKNLVMKSTNSGLYYHIEKEGEGNFIQYTDRVSFTYQGKLLDGTVFDNQTKPITFNVKELIGAWKEILLYLKPGGKATLICPPQLGYGDRKLDDIPANSCLYYEIEVITVE